MYNSSSWDIHWEWSITHLWDSHALLFKHFKEIGIWKSTVVKGCFLSPLISSMCHALQLPVSGRDSTGLVPLFAIRPCSVALQSQLLYLDFRLPCSRSILDCFGHFSVVRISHNAKGCSFSAKPNNPMKIFHVSALISDSKIIFSYIFTVKFQSINQSLMGQNLQIARILAQNF